MLRIIFLFLYPALFFISCSGDNGKQSKAAETTGSSSAADNMNSDKADTDLPLDKIKLPPGFKISVYAKDLKGARSLALGSGGTLFIGTRDEDVYAVRDEDSDGSAEKVYIIAKSLNKPNGVAFRKGSLYVAEVDKVIRFDNIEQKLADPPRPVVINNKFPSDRHHGWKYIAFGPDDKLYVPVGAPCNVCEKDYNKYENIMRMNADGSGLETFAKGIRNTVGFAWHPQTKELWFTENGRDMMGDNIPPDELNHAPKAGMHFGFPYCHGKDIKDPEFGDKHNCADFTPPVQLLGPHIAALGMKFYTGNSFPSEYRNQVFIAEHGSWNRTSPLGYRIMLVKLNGNKAVSYTPFAEGWLNDGDVWGRPVDVLVMPDGSLLVSDDKAGVVYKISYN